MVTYFEKQGVYRNKSEIKLFMVNPSGGAPSG